MENQGLKVRGIEDMASRKSVKKLLEELKSEVK